MKDFSYSKHVWEKRGELDKAIINRDLKTINIITTELKKLFEEYDIEATRTMGWSYYNIDDEYKDKEKNAKSLIRNINDIYYKYILEIDVPTKYTLEPRSVATCMWVARTLYDDVILKCKNKKFGNRKQTFLKKLEKAERMIYNCIRETENLYVYSINESVFLKDLLNEVMLVKQNLFDINIEDNTYRI